MRVSELLEFEIITEISGKVQFSDFFKGLLSNDVFREFLIDSVQCAIMIFDRKFNLKRYCEGFQLYQKYSRKDVFRILNYYDFNLATFSVYDRWGQVVYDGSDNSMIGWDGNYKGRAQPIGVYTYYISGVSMRFNKSLSESGNFTLMR